MEEILAMLPMLSSLLPLSGFIWWVISNMLDHSSRIKKNEDDIKDFKELKIGENIKDHDTRIRLLEHAYHTTTVKLDQLIGDVGEIKGLLKSKKDKE